MGDGTRAGMTAGRFDALWYAQAGLRQFVLIYPGVAIMILDSGVTAVGHGAGLSPRMGAWLVLSALVFAGLARRLAGRQPAGSGRDQLAAARMSPRRRRTASSS